ncbi:MAG: LysR family transcriptional regulator [Rhizobiales bacterium]|nr:LysR family transcriptional regulator [Hyphomicrobiales bacterium]
MELRHLRYIVASARNGSFSAAANKLNVRQPIVSKRIKEVEDELGIPLFDRSTAGARLTPIGEEFVLSARRIVDEIDLLAHRARASRSGKLGRVVVGFYASLSSGGLRAAVRDFRDQYPDIEAELIETPFLDLLAGVLSDTVDVVIQLGDTIRGEALESISLWSERLVETLHGGGRERGARVTPLGRRVLAQYRAIEAHLAVEATVSLAALLGDLRATPLPARSDADSPAAAATSADSSEKPGR